MKYRVQVNTFGDPDNSWAGNAVTYASRAQAKHAAENLFQRWTAVKFWRVIDQDDKVVLEQDLLADSEFSSLCKTCGGEGVLAKQLGGHLGDIDVEDCPDCTT